MRVGLKNLESDYSVPVEASSAGSGRRAGQSAQAEYLGLPSGWTSV